MAAVPGGSFTLGEVAREALLQPFCLDITEVTVASYRACVARGVCPASEVGSEYFLGKPQAGSCNFRDATRGDHPMNCVNWEQATGYCEARGSRLPREAEWEWAARGGAEARAYPWGSSAPGERACWRDTGAVEVFDVERMAARNGTCAVASQGGDKGRFGHQDLAANVAEWAADFDPAKPTIRITRGGGWLFGAPSTLRASFREPIVGTTRTNRIGFRCAK
jgi:formylglycine-generating enzyme required for sulfatase activity